MPLTSRLEQLKMKHETLSAEVEAMQRAPGIADLQIAEMKKQKLKLKEQISRLSS